MPGDDSPATKRGEDTYKHPNQHVRHQGGRCEWCGRPERLACRERWCRDCCSGGGGGGLSEIFVGGGRNGASTVKRPTAEEIGDADGGSDFGTSAGTLTAAGMGKGKQSNKPQGCATEPLKELRLGRCFTLKQQDYQNIFNMLEKLSSGHGAPLSSNSELSGQRGEACQTSSSSTWMSAPASYPASLTPQYERLVHAINEKTQGFNFL